jgi:DNA-binding LacI/PurR family transcriptional regulator
MWRLRVCVEVCVAISIRQVAAKAGVSKAAVSMALRDHPNIPEATRQQIKRIAAELGYRPSLVAQTLSCQKTQTLGVVVPGVRGDNTFAPILWAVDRVARNRGYSVIACNTDMDLNVETDAFDVLYRRRVEGVVFVPSPEPNADVSPIQQLEQRGIPVVVASEKPMFEKHFTTVFFDNDTVSKEMTEHLIRLGHRRIAFLHVGLDVVKARWEGYCQALRAHRIAYDESLVVQVGRFGECESPQPSDTVAGLTELLARPDRPTALFAYTDILAVRVLRALGKMGVRVPDDVAVVGFDDLSVTQHLLPSLTTVHQPAEEIGTRAAELLFDRIEGRRSDADPLAHERVASRLVIRESCGYNVSKRPKGKNRANVFQDE